MTQCAYWVCAVFAAALVFGIAPYVHDLKPVAAAAFGQLGAALIYACAGLVLLRQFFQHISDISAFTSEGNPASGDKLFHLLFIATLGLIWPLFLAAALYHGLAVDKSWKTGKLFH